MGTAFRYAQQLPQHIDLSDIQASTADFFFFKLGLNCLHSRDWCTTILWLTLAHSYGTAQNNTIATTSVYRRAFLLSNWHQKTHTVLITVTWEQSFQALICSQFLQGRFKTSVLLCSHTHCRTQKSSIPLQPHPCHCKDVSLMLTQSGFLLQYGKL